MIDLSSRSSLRVYNLLPVAFELWCNGCVVQIFTPFFFFEFLVSDAVRWRFIKK
jgi:hypothetical protein